MRCEGTDFLFWVLPKAELKRKKYVQMADSGTPSQGGEIGDRGVKQRRR